MIAQTTCAADFHNVGNVGHCQVHTTTSSSMWTKNKMPLLRNLPSFKNVDWMEAVIHHGIVSTHVHCLLYSGIF